MPSIVTEIPAPQAQPVPSAGGLRFPVNGTGLTFDAGYPLKFPSDAPGDLRRLFPSYVPQPEIAIYDVVRDACESHAAFPADGQGIAFPVQFNVAPQIGLYADRHPGETIAFSGGRSRVVDPIPVTRGWPAYPGRGTPAIGIVEAEASDDEADESAQAGFAGDVFARDALGNVIATAAYYAQPLRFTIIVELIHTNRDERDRLHDQLRLVIYPLRSTLPATTSQIREVRVDSEKQDLPVDEQPTVMYISLFTVTVRGEALIATEIVPGGVIDRIVSTVEPTPIPFPESNDAPTDQYT